MSTTPNDGALALPASLLANRRHGAGQFRFGDGHFGVDRPVFGQHVLGAAVLGRGQHDVPPARLASSEHIAFDAVGCQPVQGTRLLVGLPLARLQALLATLTDAMLQDLREVGWPVDVNDNLTGLH